MCLMVLADAGILRLLGIFFRILPLALRKVGILCAADRAFLIYAILFAGFLTDTFLLPVIRFFFRFLIRLFCFPAGFRIISVILRCPAIADFTYKSTGASRHSFGVAAGTVMLMPAVQLLCDTAALFTAGVTAFRGLSFPYVSGCALTFRHRVRRITAFRMFVDTVLHGFITVLRMLMGTLRPRLCFPVAAVRGMRPVVFTQPSPALRCGCGGAAKRQRLEYQRRRQQDSQRTFCFPCVCTTVYFPCIGFQQPFLFPFSPLLTGKFPYKKLSFILFHNVPP